MKKLNFKCLIFFLSILYITCFENFSNATSNIQIEVFSILLAPPFDSKSLTVNSYGRAYYEYEFSLSNGGIETLSKAVKGFGELRSSNQIVLSMTKAWNVNFDGEIVGIEVTYSLKGFMKIQSSSDSNVYSGACEVYFSLNFDGKSFTLEHTRLEQYGYGEKSRYFFLTNEVRHIDFRRTVSKGDRIPISVVLLTLAEAFGTIYDSSFAVSDFLNGDFGAEIKVRIKYLEKTVLTAKTSKNKVYLGETIIVTGELTSSTGIPLPNRQLDFYFDGKFIKSISTMNDGSFRISYTIPKSINPGVKVITVKFNGDRFYLSSQYSLSILIPTFKLISYAPGIKIPVGSSSTIPIVIENVNGYERRVRVYISNLPSWLKAKFIGPSSGFPKFYVDIYLTALDEGYVLLRITGVGDDGQVRSYIMPVRAYEMPSFKIQVSPINKNVSQGGLALYNVTITPLNGFKDTVYLNLISHEITFPFNFSENPVLIRSEAKLYLLIHVPSWVEPNVYNFRVMGRSSNIEAESNVFSLNVTPLLQPQFRINAYPKNQTIIAGMTASYNVTVSSLNGFEGYVYLNVSAPDGFNASFDVNPVYLHRDELRMVNLILTSSESSEIGYYNFTVTGYSEGFMVSDWIGLTITDYPAKISFCYVNWINKKWSPENIFLPLEAVGVVVKYKSLSELIVEFPEKIVSSYYNSTVLLKTNSSGIATTIIPLNTADKSIGSHTIKVRNIMGEIIGEGIIEVDGAKVDYIVENYYGYSVIYFKVNWASTRSPILNRDGTLQLELHFPDNSIIRSNSIMSNGSIIFISPRLDIDAIVTGYLVYSGSNQRIFEDPNTPTTIKVRFRSIASYLLKSQCIDLNYNLIFQFYYRFTLEPACNVTVKLVVLDGIGRVISSVERNASRLGEVQFSLHLPLTETLDIRLLCRDRSKKWVASTKWADLYVARENLRVLLTVFKNHSLLHIGITSLCSLMDLHCTLTIKIYDEAGLLQYSSIRHVLITHGSILTIRFPLNGLRAYYVHVKVTFNDLVIGEFSRRIRECEW